MRPEHDGGTADSRVIKTSEPICHPAHPSNPIHQAIPFFPAEPPQKTRWKTGSTDQVHSKYGRNTIGNIMWRKDVKAASTRPWTGNAPQSCAPSADPRLPVRGSAKFQGPSSKQQPDSGFRRSGIFHPSSTILHPRPGERRNLTRRRRSVSGALNETRFVLRDSLDPAAILSSAGVVDERCGYDAFGPVRVMDANFATRSSSTCAWNWLYHGEFLDGESGMYDYGYRFYHPALGRWASRDPIGERGGVNLYGFVGNGGVSRVDYLGLIEPPPGRDRVKVYICYGFVSCSSCLEPDPCILESKGFASEAQPTEELATQDLLTAVSGFRPSSPACTCRATNISCEEYWQYFFPTPDGVPYPYREPVQPPPKSIDDWRIPGQKPIPGGMPFWIPLTPYPFPSGHLM
jgi:RHS repeat-associated protein